MKCVHCGRDLPDEALANAKFCPITVRKCKNAAAAERRRAEALAAGRPYKTQKVTLHRVTR